MSRPPIHRILYFDFLGALATVVVMVVGADALAPQVGVGAPALRSAGVVLVPFVAFVLLTARRNPILRRPVLTIIAVNLLWLLASILLLAFGTTTRIGAWIIATQAFLIVPLAHLEIRALPPRG